MKQPVIVGHSRRYIGQQSGIVMKSAALGTTVGVIGVGALEIVAQVADDKWVQMVRDIGFPVIAAIGLGLGFRAFINRVMNVYERIIEENRKREDQREENDRKRDEENANHNRRILKLLAASNMLAKEVIVQLKEVAVRVSHQTTVVRSEAQHTAEVLVKADEGRASQNK